MKTAFRSLRLLGVLALLAASCTAVAKPKTVHPSRVEVTWTDPTRFAELRESPSSSRVRMKPEEWLGQLARSLRQRAERILPKGEHLSVTITDVKRAGTFEPWRGPNFDDVRIIKDIYPPRINLRFTLLAADGRQIADGERELRDPAFLGRSTPFQSDPLRYEKRLLADWLRREFGPKRS